MPSDLHTATPLAGGVSTAGGIDSDAAGDSGLDLMIRQLMGLLMNPEGLGLPEGGGQDEASSEVGDGGRGWLLSEVEGMEMRRLE